MDDFGTRLRRDLPRGQGNPLLDRGVKAQWLNHADMRGEEWGTKDGLILGRDENGKLIGWQDDRHVMLIAGSRSGKGTGIIIPTLVHGWRGSAVVLDTKGELARDTSERRERMGQTAHVLDPFNQSGCDWSVFNPLDELDNIETVIDDSALMADALIIGNERDPYWTDAARALLQALILMVLQEPHERRNLVTVRNMLMLTDAKIAAEGKRLKAEAGEDEETSQERLRRRSATYALISLLMNVKNDVYGHICQGMGYQLNDMEDKERGSVLNTARVQTRWIGGGKGIEETLSGKSSFRLRDLKKKRMTLYLCLPATYMSSYNRWLRLIVAMTLTVMERTKPEQVKPPVLFLLDEFPVLKYMESIESALSQMAGFGVKIMTVIQNIGQLKHLYKGAWETFVGNSGVIVAFGNTDVETLTWLTKMLGYTDVDDMQPTGAAGLSLERGNPLEQPKRVQLPLMAEHELRLQLARQHHRALVITSDHAPVILQRIRWFDDPEFKSLVTR